MEAGTNSTRKHQDFLMVHLGGLNNKQAFALCAGRALFSQGWGGCVPASAALSSESLQKCCRQRRAVSCGAAMARPH